MNEPIAANGNARQNQATMYSRSPYTSTGGSPPSSAFRNDGFPQMPGSVGSSQLYGSSPIAERHGVDRNAAAPSLTVSISDPAVFGSDKRSPSAILIRRLPSSIGQDALGSMLIFAGDLIDTEFVRSPYPEDRGFSTAYARFKTFTGARDAQQKLHGKPNTTKEANMIVEMHNSGVGGQFERRATVDGGMSRGQTSSASSGGSIGAPPGRSRFGSTFGTGDHVSPPLPSSGSGSNGDFPAPETGAQLQHIFSPTSPVANGVTDRSRVSGKSIINDSTDDETGELIRDPLTYARSGSQQQGSQRRATGSQIPVTRFASLSVSTAAANGAAVGSPPGTGMTSPRQPSVRSPVSPTGLSPNGMFSFSNPKHQYPPINPADQNPPCNTLYVGNLPIDTSEDELKALFSKQRGYKRLCFRTKHNGPMCFVEFEDVSFATKALNELYGHPLHNSVKGGIRLSFSKNPLGVRSGQTNGIGGPNMPMSPHAMAPGFNSNNSNNTGGMMANGGFSAASGPPPGLPSPSLMGNGGGGYARSPTGMEGMFANPFGLPAPSQSFVGGSGMMSPRSNTISGGVPPPMGSGTFGRDARGTYSDYMMGR